MDIQTLVEQIVTIVGAIAGVALAIDKTRGALMGLFNSKPLKRKAISADLELLKLMKENDPGYEELQNHIKDQVQTLIRHEEKKELVSGNWSQLIVGLLMCGGFGYWTYYIVNSPQISNWWTILTGWMTLAGFGFLSATFQRPRSTMAHSTNTESHATD